MDYLLLLSGFVFLILGGHWLLKAAVGLSLRLMIPRIIIGMTVVSFATSAPELIVSLNSALEGHADIALGNVIGSNIANLGLVLGIVTIFSTIGVEKSFYKTDWPVMMIASIMLYIFIVFDGVLQRYEGIIMLFSLIVFLLYLLRFQKKAVVVDEVVVQKEMSIPIILFFLILGGVGLWGGSELLIKGAINLASDFGVSERVIGVTIISIGTSVPELAASIIAIVKKEKAISLGNLIGSNEAAHEKRRGQRFQRLSLFLLLRSVTETDVTNQAWWITSPVVLQDRFFTADKTALDYSPTQMQISRGYIGDVFITNGAIEPTFEAEAKEIRFRLLNGSDSSVYDLGFSNGKSFKQIGGDNSLLEAPVSMTRLVLSPGERAEIVVDLSNDSGASFTLHEYKNNKTFMTVNVSKDATAVTSLPNSLAELDPIDLSLVTNTRKFNLGMQNMVFTINGKAMDMKRIDEVVSLGDTEIWEVSNMMGMDHNFHMHATHFRVIERNGSAANVLENEKGYKDVVYLKGNERVKLLVKMTDYADETVPYMYHCHFLEHENNAMMGQFTVE